MPFDYNMVEAKILNQNYLKWKYFPLSNQLEPIKVSFSVNIDDSLALYVSKILIKLVMTLCPLLVFFSFGSLNTGFEIFFLSSFYLYLNKPMTDLTTSIISEMNIANIWQVFSPYIIPSLKL